MSNTESKFDHPNNNTDSPVLRVITFRDSSVTRTLLDVLFLSALGVSALVPVPISIVAGANHTCALLSDGRVVCWGRNQFGQLGIESTADLGTEPWQMGTNLTTVNLGEGTIKMVFFYGTPLSSKYCSTYP